MFHIGPEMAECLMRKPSEASPKPGSNIHQHRDRVGALEKKRSKRLRLIFAVALWTMRPAAITKVRRAILRICRT
jgi:hypothetical protein